MRILLLNDFYLSSRGGGAAASVKTLIDELEHRGHEVYLLTTTQDKNLAGTNKNILTIYVPHYHERWRAYLSLYNRTAVRQVKKIISQINPDVIHAHNIHYYLSYQCLKIAKQTGKKVFITLHDVMSFHYGKMVEMAAPNQPSIPEHFNYKISGRQIMKKFKKRYNPLRNIIIKKYLRYADKIFAVSRALRDACEQNGIGNIAVIPNGINTRVWETAEDEINKFKSKYNIQDKKTILFAGRINELKGGRIIVKTLRKIKTKINNAALMVLSKEDEYATEIKNMAAKYKLNDDIIFTGWLNGNKLKSAFHACTVVAVPSICFDSFPTVNLEAFACKKPVVATCFGGSKEIVANGINGYIVNPYDTDDLADKIASLLKNPSQAEAFGRAGYEIVAKDFSIEKNYETTIRFYSEN